MKGVDGRELCPRTCKGVQRDCDDGCCDIQVDKDSEGRLSPLNMAGDEEETVDVVMYDERKVTSNAEQTCECSGCL